MTVCLKGEVFSSIIWSFVFAKFEIRLMTSVFLSEM